MNVVIESGRTVSSKFWAQAVKVSQAFSLERALQAVLACHPRAKNVNERQLLLYAYDLCFEELREVLEIRSFDLTACQAEIEGIIDQYPALKEEAVKRERSMLEQLAALEASAAEQSAKVYRLRAERVFNLGDPSAVSQAQSDYDAAMAQVEQLKNALSVSTESAFERHYKAELDSAKKVLKDKFEYVNLLNNWKDSVVKSVLNSESAQIDASKALAGTYLVESHPVELR